MRQDDRDTDVDSRAGELIAGKYSLTRLLGSGGMGAVYAAEHQFTQRKVAVKLMHPEIARASVAAERFLREAQAPSAIGHPGIVEVLDGGHHEDGSLYLVLELLEGETLSDAIDRRRMAPDELCEVMLQLLDALAAAHEAGFVHRDLKPDNIFLARDRGGRTRVKLLDFGIAGLTRPEQDSPNLTVAGTVLGTPLYMSPEQAQGRRLDERSDLWSAGAVLYRALAGRPPFRGDSYHALVVSLATEQHVPLAQVRSDLPTRLCEAVERALKKDLEARWQSARDMARALSEVVEIGKTRALGPAARARPAAPAQTPRPGLPRWFAALVAGTIALLGVTGFIALKGGGASPSPKDALGALGDEDIARDDGEHKTAASEPAGDEDIAAPNSDTQTQTDTQAETERLAETERTGDAPVRAGAGLSPSQLSSALAEHQAALQRCYEDVVVADLLAHPERADEAGPLRVDIALIVTPEGSASQVTARGPGAPSELRRCLETDVASWRFPPIERATKVGFPVVFQPNVVR